VQPPFDNSVTLADLTTLEPSLEPPDLGLMRTGATGALGTTGLDARIPNATSLPNTEFQLTGPNVPYDSYTGDTVHRLFHMWQQSDCDIANATPANPSGCLNDLYPFVATARDDSGGNAMGFYNMQNGDVPLLDKLASQIRDERQFSPVGHGRHRGKSRRTGHRRLYVLDDFHGTDDAAVEYR
jgi:phospholipase C